MKKTVIFSAKISLGFLAMITVGYYIGAPGLVKMFMDNTAIVAYGSKFLRGLCLSLVFLNMDFMAVGVFQACGLGRKSLIFAILRKIVLEIPILLLLNRLFPLYGLAYAQPAAEIILAAAAVMELRKIFRGSRR